MKKFWLIIGVSSQLVASNSSWIDDARTEIRVENRAMSHLEKVKKIVTGLKAGDPGAFAHYVSDELEIDSPVLAEIPQQANPSKMFVSVLQYWLSAFPTVASRWVSVDESEDQVVVHWEASAIHSGTDFLGVPARGREFEYSGTTTYTFAGGQLVAYSAQVDTDAILAQISEE